MGETLTYTVKVQNTGSQAATNTVVKDALPSTTTYVRGSTNLDGQPLADVGGASPVAAGLNLGTVDYRAGTTTSHTLTFEVRINSGVADGTQICNTATVDSDQTSAKSLTTSPCTTVSAPNLQAPPTLSVTDLDGTPTVPGHHLRYNLKLTNAGSQQARNISVRADLPRYVRGLSVVVVPSGATDASAGSGGANGTGYVKVDGITVPGNFSVNVIFEVTIDTTAQLLAEGVASYDIDGLKLPVQASVSAPYLTRPYVSDNPATTASPIPPWSPSTTAWTSPAPSPKTAVNTNGAPLVPVNLVDYVVTIKNTRNRDAHVVVTDDLPAQVQGCVLLQAPTGTTCSSTGGAFGSGQLVTPKVVVAAGGGTVTLRFSVKVRNSAADGSLVVNSASLAADELKDPVRVTSNGLTVVNRPVLSQGRAPSPSSISTAGTSSPGTCCATPWWSRTPAPRRPATWWSPIPSRRTWSRCSRCGAASRAAKSPGTQPPRRRWPPSPPAARPPSCSTPPSRRPRSTARSSPTRRTWPATKSPAGCPPTIPRPRPSTIRRRSRWSAARCSPAPPRRPPTSMAGS